MGANPSIAGYPSALPSSWPLSSAKHMDQDMHAKHTHEIKWYDPGDNWITTEDTSYCLPFPLHKLPTGQKAIQTEAAPKSFNEGFDCAQTTAFWMSLCCGETSKGSSTSAGNAMGDSEQQR